MDSKPLCRLCIEEIDPLLEIFGNFGREAKIPELIAVHFWFQIKPDDLLSDKICTECWSKLVDFHTFYQKIQKAQGRITMVIIEEGKSNDGDFDDDTKHEIVITQEEFGEDLEDLHIENGSDRDAGGEAKTTIKIQCTDYALKPGVKIQSAASANECQSTAELTISCSDDSDGSKVMTLDISIEDSTQLSNTEDTLGNESQPLDDSYMETTEAETDAKEPPAVIRNYLNKRIRKVKCNIDNDQETYAKTRKSKSLRVRRENRTEKRESSEAQKQREIDLIESYFKMECDLCHKNLGNFLRLFDHYREEHQFRGFIVCCGRKFFRQPVIAEHVLWHQRPEDFTCKTCNKNFSNKRCYDNHMLSSHAPPDVPLYQCEQCIKTFAKKYKLDKHKLSHLKDDEKQYTCDECDKPYATDALLRAHKRVVHQQSYAHMCDICARVFKSRVFFEKHQLEHLGQDLPKVQCKICLVWMKNEHTMRAHMRNHQDEGQEHQCDICGKKGPSRNAIAKHKRFVHMSERKFKCGFCDKAFKRAITLKEHITIHTGEVLYKCTFCQKTFNSGANMHAHRKKAHPSEWLQEKRSKLDSMKPIESDS